MNHVAGTIKKFLVIASGKKNVLTEILPKISHGRTRNPSVGEFSTGILGCKNVFWSIELVLLSIANQTI